MFGSLRRIWSALFFATLVFAADGHAVPAGDKSESGRVAVERALGIYDHFGRWPDSIQLGYDPRNAPDMFDDPEYFIELIEEAAGRWERVSGISFDILPYGNYPKDRESTWRNRDGVVAVFWDELDDGVAGRGGPVRAPFANDLGYFPYVDGNVRLNQNSAWSYGKQSVLRTLVHELGHLIGLGHSDIPDSIMYADPYNQLRYPAEDDIRAVQVLYGSPDLHTPAHEPVEDWIYEPPTRADSDRTRFVFSANQHSSYGYNAAFAISDTRAPISEVTDDTPAGSVNFIIPVGNFDAQESIEIPVILNLISPSGYLYRSISRVLDCAVGYACLEISHLIDLDVLKSLPGQWTLYVTDDPDHTENPRLLHSATLSVNTNRESNAVPDVRLLVDDDPAMNSLRVRLIAHDHEQDAMTAYWHMPNTTPWTSDWEVPQESVEQLDESGFSDWQEIDVDSLDNDDASLDFYVQVNDDVTRYGQGDSRNTGRAAGGGFQTLLRVSVSKPSDEGYEIAVRSSSVRYNEDTHRRLWARVKSYEPTSDWPSPYNGVQPSDDLELEWQNIGHLDSDAMEIRSCVRILENDDDATLEGIHRYDVVFDVLDREQAVLRLNRYRPFNEAFALTADSELPDCSGSYDLAKGVYKDVVEVESDTYRARFDVTDPDALRFRLHSASEL